jgi:hypothetical protein
LLNARWLGKRREDVGGVVDGVVEIKDADEYVGEDLYWFKVRFDEIVGDIAREKTLVLCTETLFKISCRVVLTDRTLARYSIC